MVGDDAKQSFGRPPATDYANSRHAASAQTSGGDVSHLRQSVRMRAQACGQATTRPAPAWRLQLAAPARR